MVRPITAFFLMTALSFASPATASPAPEPTHRVEATSGESEEQAWDQAWDQAETRCGERFVLPTEEHQERIQHGWRVSVSFVCSDAPGC